MVGFLCASSSCAAATRPRVSPSGAATRAHLASHSWASVVKPQLHQCCTTTGGGLAKRRQRRLGIAATSAEAAPGKIKEDDESLDKEFREKMTWGQIEGVMNEDTVGNVMSKNVRSIHENASVFEAMQTLVDNRISAVPVVNDKDQVLGVISEYDLMTRLGSKKSKTKVEEDGMFPRIGRCDEFGGSMKDMWNRFRDLQERVEKASGTRVGDAMHDTQTVTPDTLLVDATEIMLNHRYHRLSVVDDEDVLIGVLSRGDVMRRTFQVYNAAQRGGMDVKQFRNEVLGADPSDPGINSEELMDGGLDEFCNDEPDQDECRIYSF